MLTTIDENVPTAIRRESPSPFRAMLEGVFEMLDAAGIAYCVLNGNETLADHTGSDVDCIIDARIGQAELLRLFHANRAQFNASVIRVMGLHLTLAGRDSDGSAILLELDFSRDCVAGGIWLCAGSEVLESRIRHGKFWIPAPASEFGCYLGRTIAKARFDGSRGNKLLDLYRRDPIGCEAQVSRLWKGEQAGFVISSLLSGEWGKIQGQQRALRAHLWRRALTLASWQSAKLAIEGQLNRIGRLLRPHGLSTVFLGPDGAGKSSTVDAVQTILAPVFSRTVCWGFAPPLRRLLRRKPTPTNQPHALAPRSLPVSLLRVAYWLLFNTLGSVHLRFATVRSTLVLYDRHFIDILVDPVRYRYGGPKGLLKFVWWLAPKPDLVVLLHAPPEVLQARKQEVPIEVTARQLSDYLALVRTLPYGRCIDAGQPHRRVANDVSSLIVQFLAQRIEQRFDLASPGENRVPSKPSPVQEWPSAQPGK